MLVIISDLHLTDGTSGASISPGAFEIFADRLQELAVAASWRAGGRYQPIDRLDLLLLGDILDVIRSSRWLQSDVRPWSGQEPRLCEAVTQITSEILRHNEPALAVLRRLASASGLCVPAGANGRPDPQACVPVRVNIHYMVGNHDWFFHLPGTGYNRLRQLVANSMGLASPADQPFPHEPAESNSLLEALRRHKIFARHGDVFDPFNYEGDRNQSSLGDAIVIELLSRFAQEVARELKDDLPEATLLGLRELDNVRPTLLVPVWIDGLLERTCPLPAVRRQVKLIWDRLADRFLELPFVRAHDTWNPADMVDGLERLLKFSKRISIGWAANIVRWLAGLRGQPEESYRHHALAEQDFRNRRARYIVYGHTHYPESVPLDASFADAAVLNQVYFNAGTWRRVHRQTILSPAEHEFIACDMMTYLAFFQVDERKGRPYETWCGTLGISPHEAPYRRLDAGRHANAPAATALPSRPPHFTLPASGGAIVPRRRG
jgi:UDP-2,3-diacylglucosamine pyrophosphatase LpxH